MCALGSATTGTNYARAGASAHAKPVRLQIPYSVAFDARGRLFVADGGRHQILRWDATAHRFVVFAGTGSPGASGDNGPARRARLNEVASLAFDRSGNLYVSDVHEGRVRRIDSRGVITTLARVTAPAGIDVDPSGRGLAVASIENRIYRVDLATRAVTTLAGDGTQGTTGDGGPAVNARVNGPHALAYDRAGNLYVGGTALRRIDAGSGVITTVLRSDAFLIEPARDGSLYVARGTPSGGTIFRLATDGTERRVVGTGGISRHRDRVRATAVGILPTALLLRGSALVVAQVRPLPAIRRVNLTSGVITTLAR